jgi:RNA polymerase sigma-70 factor (ECF subfamily)
MLTRREMGSCSAPTGRSTEKQMTAAPSDLFHPFDAVTARDTEDARMVLALRAGEGWASEAIWDRYSDRVRRYIARKGGHARHDVDDLTQDVFLLVFTECRRIQKPESLRHFVRSVAMNVLRTQLRYQQIRRNVCLSATGTVPDIATPPRADDEARQTLRRCYEILEGIRTSERDAFVLRYLEGMSVDEVSDRLNISRSTAKRLIGRAAKKLVTRARERLGHRRAG